MDVVTYSLCKKFALKVAAGFQSVTVDEPTSTINFTLLDGKTVSLKIPQLRGIDNIYFDIIYNPVTKEDETHLMFDMTDGTKIDAGIIPGGNTSISKVKGNRIVQKPDGIYVAREVLKLTQEEYDKLPESEKKRTDIVYFVTDPNGEPSGGSSILTQDLIASVAIGSVTKGKKYPAGTSLEIIIRDILISETAPSGVLTYMPDDKFYDIITDTVEDLSITIKAIKNTYDIAKIEFYVNDVIVETLDTAEDIKDGGTFIYNHHFDTPTNENIKLKVVITDDHDLKGNPNTVIKFVGRSYFGFVPETVTVPTEADVKGLQNSTLKDKSTLTYEDIPIPQDGQLYKVLYAYEKTCGKINKIVDADGRDYTGSYTESELQVDGIDYYAYILTDGTGTAGATQKFS